jgi:hypothetical protein
MNTNRRESSLWIDQAQIRGNLTASTASEVRSRNQTTRELAKGLTTGSLPQKATNKTKQFVIKDGISPGQSSAASRMSCSGPIRRSLARTRFASIRVHSRLEIFRTEKLNRECTPMDTNGCALGSLRLLCFFAANRPIGESVGSTDGLGVGALTRGLAPPGYCPVSLRDFGCAPVDVWHFRRDFGAHPGGVSEISRG